MNNLKKIMALMLAVVMFASLCACSQLPKTLDKQWSYKDGDSEYAIGVHIYSLVSAYNQAYSVLSEAQGDKFDSSASILGVESSFDESGEIVLCKDWILKEADYITKNLMAIDNLIAEYDVEIDPALENSSYQQALKDWDLGPYYEEYRSYGYTSTPYKEILEPCGVSFESFYEATYLASVKQSTIFNHFYKKDGIKAVKESEVKKFFEDNFTSYSYFTVNLYESSVDSTTNQTVNKALPEDKIKEIKTNLDFYAAMIKSGTSFDDVSGAYTAYAQLSTNPAVSCVENLENSSLPEEIADVVAGLKVGQPKVIYLGEEETTVAYFVYKKSITKETKSYVGNETNYESLLQEMKSEEFLSDMEKITAEVQCEINTAIVDKYTPELIENLI